MLEGNAQTTTHLHSSHMLVKEKAMAPHSITLAWKIPWMEEPCRQQVHGVARSRTWLSDFTFNFHFHALEKETATHSSVLAWRTPGTGEPSGLPSMGSHRVKQDWSKLAAAAAHPSKVMLKILQARLSNMWTVNFQMFKLVLEKAIKWILSGSHSFLKVVLLLGTN